MVSSMYKVIDLAKMFDVSKVTIYKKISSNKTVLKGHIVKKKNITYLDDEAVEIIKLSLHMNKEKVSGRLIDEELDKMYASVKNVKDINEKLKTEKINLLEDQNLDLESMIRYLKSQIIVKKNHMNVRDEILFNFKDVLKINKNRIRNLDELLLKNNDNQ